MPSQTCGAWRGEEESLVFELDLYFRLTFISGAVLAGGVYRLIGRGVLLKVHPEWLCFEIDIDLADSTIAKEPIWAQITR